MHSTVAIATHFMPNRRIEALERQANQMKLQGRWLEAGDAFCKAAKLHHQKGSSQAQVSIAYSLGDAANCFKKVEPRYAILALETAASLRAQLGQFADAAAIHEDIADLARAMGRRDRTDGCWLMLGGSLDEARRLRLEDLQQVGGLDAAVAKTGKDTGGSWWNGTCMPLAYLASWTQGGGSQAPVSCPAAATVAQSPSAMQLAVRHYQTAADRFSTENLTARECECLTKRAELLTEMGDLGTAAQQFLQLAGRALSHELLAFGAVKFAFKACLCRLQADCSGEAAGPEQLLAEAEVACPTFTRSEEADFIRELAEAVQESDAAAVDGARRRFEAVSSLDNFCTQRLRGLREALTGGVQLI